MAELRLIDANALLNKKRRMYAPDEIDSIDPIATACVTVDDVHRTPTIDAVPVVHGRWVRFVEDLRHHIEYDMCSGCGFKYGGIGVEHFRYCPNCGAKMDGGAEG